MEYKRCSLCGDGYLPEDMESNTCRFCLLKAKFSAFARECGLDAYPDPRGERYVFHLDGDCAGKKSECLYFIDELWNALVRARGKESDGLLVGE